MADIGPERRRPTPVVRAKGRSGLVQDPSETEAARLCGRHAIRVPSSRRAIRLVGLRGQRGAQQPPERGIVGRIRRDAQRFVDGAPDPIDVAPDATKDDGGAHHPDAVDHGVPRPDGLGRGCEELSCSLHVAAHGADLGQRFEIPGCGATPVRLGKLGLAQRHGLVPTTEIDVAVDEVGDEERPEAAERADPRLPVELVADHCARLPHAGHPDRARNSAG